MAMEAETGVIGLQSRNTKDCRQPLEAQKSQEPSEPLDPAERACPCQYLGFGLLASRTPVLSHTVVLCYSSLSK